MKRLPGLRPTVLLATLLALPLLLAGCGGDRSADDDRSASGEVLEGTISDAMLPVDTVSSQPPLAEPERARASRPGADDAASGAAEESGAVEGAAGDAAEVAPTD